MDMELLWDGLKAMILGMAMVYLFLTIMIWAIKLTSKILAPFAERFEPKKETPAKKKTPAVLSDEKLAHAAVAAVELFKQSGKSTVSVLVDGKNISVNVTTGAKTAAPAAAPAASAAAGELQILSPLPGTIVRIDVAAGDKVAAGNVLAVIEAMKMETEIRAEKSGTITDILVSPKDVVSAEQPIIAMEEEK